MQKRITKNQARGMLIGLAIGDAMGSDGCAWSGFTSQALCMAQALRSANGWDAEDVMRRLINWRDFGYMAPNKEAEMSDQTAAALDRFEADGNPYAGGKEDDGAGSDGLARIAPAVIAYAAKIERAAAVSQLQSKLTHASPLCQKMAHQMAEFMVTGDYIYIPEVDTPPEDQTGYVMHTAGGAYWAMRQGFNFSDVLKAAVSLPGDTRAVGALTGQLAGRMHGYEGIPIEMRTNLRDHDKILGIADDLFAMRPIDV